MRGTTLATGDGMTATIFQLTGERFSGTGVICPEARYVTVQRHGAERPDRLHLSPELWRQVEKILADTIPATPFGPESPIVEALIPREHRRSVTVRYLWRLPVDPEPVGLVARPDALLAPEAAR